MPRIRPWLGIIFSLLLIALCLTPQVQSLLNLPPYQRLVVGESSIISLPLPDKFKDKFEMQVINPSQSVFASPQEPLVTISASSSGYEIVALKPGKVNVKLKLLGYIPIKSMAVETLPTKRVVVGGHSIGVVLQSRGIMVVGYAAVSDSEGKKIYPAREQGVEIGDLIYQVDGKSLGSESELAQIIDENKTVLLGIERGGKKLAISVSGIYCPETNRCRIGLYVRDGIVGVGTLTFWEPESKTFAALGHVIIDADTKQQIEVLLGRIVSASIQGIKPGKAGQPGEKIGVFNGEGEIEGKIEKNSYSGIYGKTGDIISNPLSPYSVEVAYAHQVNEGSAQIMTVVNGDDIEAFDIMIEKVFPGRQDGKSMIIKVIDPRLLNLTGGIIQGMSGSPIIQEGKIVGAVTHVFLNDPTRGYGIFMDDMLSEIAANSSPSSLLSTKSRVAWEYIAY